MQARLVAITLALLALAACARPERPLERPEVRLAVGGREQLVYLPVTLAVELGYTYDEGLNVVIRDFTGGSRALASLRDGSSDVVCGFYDHVIVEGASGRGLEAFLVLLRYPGFVAASFKPGIASIADLRGHTVGVTAPGSSSHLFLDYLLAVNGLRLGDVSVTGIGVSSAALGAVTRGEVDAAILTDPAASTALRNILGARLLADTRTHDGVRRVFGVDEYPASVLYTNPVWLDDHPEIALKLTRAIQRAMSWMLTRSPGEVLSRLPAEFRARDPEADVEAMRLAQAMISPTGMMTLESAENVHRLLALGSDAVRRGHVDLSRTFTNRFVQQ